MIRGIGVDLTNIDDLRELMKVLSPGTLRRMFTEEEWETSLSRSDQTAYLAGRFAVKEAVFKTMAPLLTEYELDLRRVETLDRLDGSPYIRINEAVAGAMVAACITHLHVSLTYGNNQVVAFVVAEQQDEK